MTKRFGGLLAVNNVDFDIPRGSIVSLIGPNGAGKTTFFNMITGFYVPTTGEIAFDGQPIVTMRGQQDRAREAARGDGPRHRPDVPEHPAVRDDVRPRQRPGRDPTSTSRATGGTPSCGPRACSARSEASIDAGMELLKLVGPRGARERWARNLPYGDQRRLEIARALATRPKLLLLDEPTAGMNSSETREMTDFIRRLRRTSA